MPLCLCVSIPQRFVTDVQCSKFPGSTKATQAFQKVNVAYDVLSKPGSKRVYDSKSSSVDTFDFFSTRAYAQSEETLRSVVLGVFNDFLEGDLETVRTLLRELCSAQSYVWAVTDASEGAVSDLNPSLRLGDDGIDNVVHALQSLRDRALSSLVPTLRSLVPPAHALPFIS